MTHVPNDQSLPVVTITIVLNGAGFVIRDNGGDFKTVAYSAAKYGHREAARQRAEREAECRMQHYCGFGYAVARWRVPS